MYAYLDRHVRDLDERDLFVLSAMRGWVAAARGGRCVCHALSRGFEARAVPEVLGDFVSAMATLDHNALARLRFAPVAWPKVTDDEARLLALFALDRDGEPERLPSVAAGLVADDAVAPLLGAIDAVGHALAGDAV